MADSANKKIEFLPAEWSAAIAEHVSRIPQTDVTIKPDAYFRAALQNGDMKCLSLHIDGEMVGSFFYSIQESDAGRELVAEAGYCSDQSIDAAEAGFKAWDILATQYECCAIRFQTCRLGYVRKAEKNGFELTDYVMRKVVA